MTQPPGGYPPPSDHGEQHQHPPPADPFLGPPSWDPPTQPAFPTPSRDQPTLADQHPPWAPPPGPPGPPPGGPYQPLPPAPPYGQPGSGPPYGQPGSGPPYGQPGSGPPYGGPPYGPGGGPGPYPPGPPPRKRRRGLIITMIALAGALVLCAGGGVATWLLTRDTDSDGAETPTLAVQSFLQAVYQDMDPAGAAALVCSESRDEGTLETKIDEIRTYRETEVDPSFAWTDPTVVNETEELALVEVTVTMTTGDEKTADQNLRVSVLDKDSNGWWVCDLETVDATTEPPAEDESGEESPAPSEAPNVEPTGEPTDDGE